MLLSRSCRRAGGARSLEVALALCLAACHSNSGDDDHAQAGTAGSTPNGGSGATAGQPGAGTGGGVSGGSGGSSGGATAGSANGGSAGTGATAQGGSAGTGATAQGGSAGTSGTSSAGTSSAGTSSAGGGAPSDPCETALLCDDFEGYTTTPSGKWTLNASSGTVAIDTTEHVSGTHSVKFSTQAAGSATAMMRLQGSPVFPIDGNVVYGRMLFKLEAAPTASVHWTIIAGSGLVAGQNYRSMYRYGGQQPILNGTTFVGSNMMANYETPDWYQDKSTPGSDCWHHANQRAVPVGTWTCIAWKFDGPSNAMQLSMNDQPADDLTVTGHGDGCVNAANDFTWTAPKFTTMDLGWESYQQDDARTAWIDDVVISTTPVSCPRAIVLPL
jgi:hypothetical protein